MPFCETLYVKIHICIFQGHVVIYSPCYGKYVAKDRQTDAETQKQDATERRCTNPRSGIRAGVQDAEGAGGRIQPGWTVQRDRKETR